MGMGSTASAVDSIEYILSMTGEVFHIHHSVVVRHAGDQLGFYFIFLGKPKACQVQLEGAVTVVRRASPELLTHDDMMDEFRGRWGQQRSNLERHLGVSRNSSTRAAAGSRQHLGSKWAEVMTDWVLGAKPT